MKKGKIKKVVKVKNKSKEKKHRFLFSKLFLWISILFVILLLVLVIVNYVDFSSFSNKTKEPVKVALEDKCSLIAGRLIHQIRDAEDCRLQCKNACDVSEMEFDSFSFVFVNDSCHVCDCYCK